MKCLHCRFRDENKFCENHKLRENGDGRSEDNTDDDELVYSYNEGGGFKVGDNFGCVHFERRKK